MEKTYVIPFGFDISQYVHSLTEQINLSWGGYNAKCIKDTPISWHILVYTKKDKFIVKISKEKNCVRLNIGRDIANSTKNGLIVVAQGIIGTVIGSKSTIGRSMILGAGQQARHSSKKYSKLVSIVDNYSVKYFNKNYISR